MSKSSLTCVAVYRRTVRASLERVWENVFDWEHLPWLHNGSFSSIEHVASGDWGWRAKLGLEPPTGEGILLELVREGSENRYVARTLAGPGAGSEIWTRLTPDGSARTGVEVEFHVPDVPPDAAEAVGTAFRQLYARLWDEDEAMMVHRSRELASRAEPPAAAPEECELGSLAELRARLPLVVEFAGRSYRVVDLGGELAIHACSCPHRPRTPQRLPGRRRPNPLPVARLRVRRPQRAQQRRAPPAAPAGSAPGNRRRHLGCSPDEKKQMKTTC